MPSRKSKSKIIATIQRSWAVHCALVLDFLIVLKIYFLLLLLWLPTVQPQPHGSRSCWCFTSFLQIPNRLSNSALTLKLRVKSRPGRLPLRVSRVEKAAPALIQERGNARFCWSILRSSSVGKCVWLPSWKWDTALASASLQQQASRKTDRRTRPICLQVKVRPAKAPNNTSTRTWAWQKRFIWLLRIYCSIFGTTTTLWGGKCESCV